MGNFHFLFSLHKSLIADLLTENDGAYCKWVQQGSWHQDELSIKVGIVKKLKQCLRTDTLQCKTKGSQKNNSRRDYNQRYATH